MVYEEIYKKKIDLLKGKVDRTTSNRILLVEITNDIADAYARGKISDKHYNLLNIMLSDLGGSYESINKELPSKKQQQQLQRHGSPIKTNK